MRNRFSRASRPMIISRCLVTVRRLLSVAALGALLTWPSVGRVATTVMFDMPAQPLSQALAAFSEQTGISILVTSDLIHNKIAAPVHGRLTPSTALRALLEPTDLEVRRVDASAWTLLPREPQHTDTVTPPANTVTRAYAGAVQRHIARLLCRGHADQLGRTRLALQLWVRGDGLIERVHVLDPEHAPRWGSAVHETLEGSRIAAPPPNQPTPLTVLLVRDGASPCERTGGH